VFELQLPVFSANDEDSYSRRDSLDGPRAPPRTRLDCSGSQGKRWQARRWLVANDELSGAL
jgi:hypothetical protein